MGDNETKPEDKHAEYCRVAGKPEDSTIEREPNGYTWVVARDGTRTPIGHT